MDSSNASFNDIVNSNKSRVFNTAISFLQNREDAEDITQDVFIEVYHSLEKFKQQSSISTWIYRITINKSLDFLRKKNRRKEYGFIRNLFYKESGEINLDKGHFDHPGVLLEKKENARILFAAIELLSENQKTAFILFHVEELSQKEIAEVMGTSPKAVESLIQRAKATLREKLENLYKNRGI
ncbi:MAG: RNA polymerase sigma factor [Bacteroidota bacterium]|mgnify:CR=1 FL=1|nr:RNA polymerase sigma factor [Bacteroidota bacterium]